MEIIWKQDKAREKQLHREVDRLVEILKESGAELIILFGSLARGECGPTTDIDLLVVTNQVPGESFSKRLDHFYRLLGPHYSLDLLAYTSKEFERLKQTSHFVIHAVKEGKVLYAA